MRIGDTVKKGLGLFFEFDQDGGGQPNALSEAESAPKPTSVDPAIASPRPARKSIEQILKETEGPSLEEIKPTVKEETPQQPVMGPDGTVNYAAIYQLANLPVASFTAENVLELLASLPAELPIESKRATLKVTLGALGKTSGASSESVVADASRKLAALASYAQSYAKQASDYVDLASQEITRLETQIAERKKAIEQAKSKAALMVSACDQESDRLDDVLEFFSLDAPPSKFAP